MKKVDVAKEYLDNLKSLVAAVRKETGVADLPFVYGSSRRAGIPDDLSDLEPKMHGWPVSCRPMGAQGPVRCPEGHPQFEDGHPARHREASSQRPLQHGRATGGREAVCGGVSRMVNQAARPDSAERHIARSSPCWEPKAKLVLSRTNWRSTEGSSDSSTPTMMANLSTKEFVEDGRYMTRQARQGIFAGVRCEQ